MRLALPTRLSAAALAGAMLAATLVACSRDPGPGPTLDAFLAGWRSGNLDAVGFVAPEGHGVPAAKVLEEIGSLTGELPKPQVTVAKKPTERNNVATAELVLSWPMAPDAVWAYPSTVQLARNRDKKWQMVWAPTVIHPQLTTGDVLATGRIAPARGTVLDGAGKPIVEDRTVYAVGLQPSGVKDLPGVLKELDAAFRSVGVVVDMSGVPGQVAAAEPDAFVPVVSLREQPFLTIRPRLDPLPGVFFRKSTLPLAPTREFARALLGTVGEVTKEIVDANPGRYVAGDLAGLSGLQRQYDERLRGTPGLRVLITHRAPDGAVGSTEVWRTEPRPGFPVKTTLDVAVQNAAEAALRGRTQRTALVALRVSDAAVLAVANGPDGGGVNLAFEAQVPPGSTFKVVTAYGLLEAGAVTLDAVVPCPKTLTVEGRAFKNSNDFALGNVRFRTDFAKSCNTAFASLAPRLGPTGLADAGRALGIGQPWDLGMLTSAGRVSTGGSAAERAAAAFGQGQTHVSPVALAAAVAAVARGAWQQPRLLTEPAPARPAPSGPQLKPTTLDPLRTMMREVVTVGTGSALADVPGPPVHGKTGTAEYDNNPAHTHAWFIGWRGDIAFAVFVENGGSSTASAVPVAEAFLRALPPA
ncbi:MAG TPA: penicillin-binding transpeptidase domain-containing protein [Micromonosporaceae bacterium]|nr:penicillin-binding transpeptidase domain-containing protein [Micromonosporaceae bacterium]